MERGIHELTGAAEEGNPLAAEQLFSTLYGELHRLAEHNLRRSGAPATLGATTLLHEAHLNLADRADLEFPDRARFLGFAARAMRGWSSTMRAASSHWNADVSSRSHWWAMRAPSQDALRAVEELERVADALDELARLEPGLAQSSAADEIVIDSIYVPAGQFYESALLLLRANADPSLQPLTQQVRAELGRMPR